MTPYQRRYGHDVPNPAAQPNEFVTNLLKRNSVHTYNGMPFEDGLLELLIAAAQSAPTSGMLQTWSVIALTTPEEKNKLVNTERTLNIIGGTDSHNLNAINTSSVVLIWLADLSRLDFVLKNIDTSDAIRAQITKTEYHLKAIIDATIAAQTFFMAAESMGIAGTYCGAIRQLPIKLFRQEFNLPKYTFPVFGTIHGYETGPPVRRVRPRLPIDFMLHKGSYCQLHNLNQFDEYNKVHSQRSKADVSTFEKRILDRLFPSDAKDNVSNTLKQMGFEFN